MRTRSLNTDTPVSASIVITTTGYPPVTNNYSLGSPDCSAALFEDVITDKFALRRRQGEIIMNPMRSIQSQLRSYGGPINYSKETYRVDNGAFVGRVQAVSTNVNARLRGVRKLMANMNSGELSAELSLFDYSSLALIEQIVLADALSKATSSDALALVTAAEFGKTCDYFFDSGKKVLAWVNRLSSITSIERNVLNDLFKRMGQLSSNSGRKRLLKSVPGLVRSLASEWLGYRYGLMATYYDVMSWCDAINKKPKRARFIARRHSNYTNSGTITNSWTDDWTRRYQITKRSRQTMTTAGVLVDVKALEALDRFGSTRILETMWDLTTLSFVFDWFSDIGTRLSAYEGLMRIKPLGTWVSHDSLLSWNFQYWTDWRTPRVAGDYRYEGNGTDDGNVIEQVRYRERKANPKLSAIPQFEVNLNWQRMLDGAALFASASKGLRKKMGSYLFTL